MEARQNWRELTYIQAGGCVCLPVIMIGHFLAQHYGTWSAITAIVIGNLFLLGIGLVCASMGSASGKSTVEHAEGYFGLYGKRFFSALMIACLLGWFAIQLEMMNQSLFKLYEWLGIHDISRGFSLLILGSIIMCIVRKGLSQISCMTLLCLPMLFATLGWALYDAPLPMVQGEFQFKGVSLVMATAIAMVIDTPNIYRHALTKKDGLYTTLIVHGLALPFIEIAGVYFASAYAEVDLLEALGAGKPGLWGAASALFLLMGGWVNNNANLYSAVVSAETFLKGTSHSVRTLIIGAVGVFLTFLNPLGYLENVVDGIGIAIGSMGGVLLMGHVIQGKKMNFMAYQVCWAMGAAAGYSNLWLGKTLTGIAVLDALIIAALMLLCINYINIRKIYEHTYRRRSG